MEVKVNQAKTRLREIEGSYSSATGQDKVDLKGTYEKIISLLKSPMA
jgi:hypothetical protein